MKTFKILLVAIMLLSPLFGNSQGYYKSIGLRGGVSSGVCFKKFVIPDEAVEGILSFRNHGAQFTGLREYYRQAEWANTDNIFIYYGHGAHLGYSFEDKWHPVLSGYGAFLNNFSPLLGVDGIFGIECRSKKYPIAISLDCKPFVEFSLNRLFRFVFWDFAFSVKYTI